MHPTLGWETLLKLVRGLAGEGAVLGGEANRRVIYPPSQGLCAEEGRRAVTRAGVKVPTRSPVPYSF